jgi:hypothetical protein
LSAAELIYVHDFPSKLLLRKIALKYLLKYFKKVSHYNKKSAQDFQLELSIYIEKATIIVNLTKHIGISQLLKEI